jgi:hypothetical protein
MSKKLRFLIIAMALPAVLLACAPREENVVAPQTATPTTTPTPAIDRAQLAPDAQQNPFKQFAPGLMARTIYKAEQTGDLDIEIWEMLVGPGKKSEPARLPGAGVAEVRSGTGVATIGEKREELKSGTGFSIPEGATVQFENSSQEEGLSLQVVLVRSH